ncbi:MAG: hypothetical protein RJA22_1520 [Verrucomicrobiota bacterium]
MPHRAALLALLLLILAALPGAAQTLPRPLFTLTNAWRYNQTANLDGVGWAAPAYDDTAWPSGRGVLAVEDSGNAFVTARTNTVLTLGRTTYYFRTRFLFTNSPAGVTLHLTNLVDDGAVVYLNGREVHRAYLPAAPTAITYATLASNHEAAGLEEATLSGPVVETNLLAGTNVLAVEVHQTTTTSTDIVFGLGLGATVPDPVPPPTLRMPATTPRFGYTFSNAFGALSFVNPIALRTPPGETNRLFVVEQAGVIAVITNLAAPTRTVFLNKTGTLLSGGEEGLLGLAFHPGHATNRQFYIFYTVTATSAAGTGRHNRLSRLQASAANPDAADPATEVILFEQFDEASNHNGGDLHFGPDGYLYVSLGDEGGGNDQYSNSQRLDKDFFAGLLRLDVDGRPGSLVPTGHPANTNNPLREIRYRIPPDNPWVGATTFNGAALNTAALRAEFWAAGLRNPWRFSFDPVTGQLYLADVGQSTQEEVNLIRRGGNYGWSYREGLVAGPRTGAPAGVVFDHPIVAYGRGGGTNQGYSVTGGVVYRGTNLPDLAGAYVFADYVTPNVWMLRANGTNVVPFERIASEGGIAAFGTDPRNGDILVADQDQDTLKRLVLFTGASTGSALPPTLAQTGAFTNLHQLTRATDPLTPNAGMLPYDLNVPFWSDGAHKSRWFQAPTNQRFGFAAESNWTLPAGLGWVKHFDLELTNGVPESRIRLETRILVKTTNGAYGVTYRWGNSLTNAALVPEEGLDESFVIHDGGILRTQVWHYPSRNECLQCHTPAAGHVLGFQTAQLNRPLAYPGGTSNQLDHLRRAGYFNAPTADPATLRAMARPDDESASLEWRVRSYLAANCASCHVPGGPGLGFWRADLGISTDAAGLILGPLNNPGADPANRVIVPGDPARSMLLSRLATRGPGQMPPLASHLVDPLGVALLQRWITNDLPAYQGFPQWQLARFGSTNSPAALPGADPDLDGLDNRAEYVLGTDPNLAPSRWGLGIGPAGAGIRISHPGLPNRAVQIEWAPHPGPGAPWQPLPVPGNEPRYPATAAPGLVTDPAPGASQRFYRARVTAP